MQSAVQSPRGIGLRMDETRLSVMEAITRRRTMTARYNGAELKLAPHILFERHGDLYVCALNLSKAWRSEDEQHLGQFKLTGLSDPSLLDEFFEPMESYRPEPPRREDALVLAI